MKLFLLVLFILTSCATIKPGSAEHHRQCREAKMQLAIALQAYEEICGMCSESDSTRNMTHELQGIKSWEEIKGDKFLKKTTDKSH